MIPSKSRFLQLGLFLILVLSLTIPRLLEIGSFVTIDEPYWLTAGSDFYYALGQRAFGNTVYDYHPAVTTMWIIAIGMLIYFPQYRGYGQGYFDVYKDTLDRFLLSHDHTSLGLLTVSRMIQVVLIVFLLLIVFWLIRRLLNEKIALVATLLISFDPYFLGHSRLLNHEGMLSLFNIISILSILIYLFAERKFVFLLLSGAGMGLAQLTKSSSILVIAVIVPLFLAEVLFHPKDERRKSLIDNGTKLLIWFAIAGIIYFIFWPGMWVAPGEMLYQVYGNAVSYAFQGARLSVTGGIQTDRFQPPHLVDILSYMLSILWRTTPVIWVGSIIGIVTINRRGPKEWIALAAISLIGILFVLLFGIANGRNSPHYVLSAYLALDILAAAGWIQIAGFLGNRVSDITRTWLPISLLGLVVFGQAGSALSFFPYYYTYFNPIMEALQVGPQNPNFGYGEVLERAGLYLSQKPDAANTTVISYLGRGPFSYFFPGKTEDLKNIYADAGNISELTKVIEHSDYIVLYYASETKTNRPANVLHALEEIPPEYVIWSNNIEYIRIYRVASLPSNFYQMLEP